MEPIFIVFKNSIKFIYDKYYIMVSVKRMLIVMTVIIYTYIYI